MYKKKHHRSRSESMKPKVDGIIAFVASLLARACEGSGQYVRSKVELVKHNLHFLKKIPNQTHIRDLEDWRIFILVDCSNDLAVLHTRQMLNRS
jgi:hypothetical protein